MRILLRDTCNLLKFFFRVGTCPNWKNIFPGNDRCFLIGHQVHTYRHRKLEPPLSLKYVTVVSAIVALNRSPATKTVRGSYIYRSGSAGTALLGVGSLLYAKSVPANGTQNRDRCTIGRTGIDCHSAGAGLGDDC